MDQIDRNIKCCPHFYCKCEAEDTDFLLYDAVICDESGTYELMAYDECRECMMDQMRVRELDELDARREL